MTLSMEYQVYSDLVIGYKYPLGWILVNIKLVERHLGRGGEEEIWEEEQGDLSLEPARPGDRSPA